MRFKVILLRRRGRRLLLRDARNGPTYVGRLVTNVEEFGGEQYKVLRIQPDNPVRDTALPELYEAMLVRFSPVAIRLRGYERVGGAHDAHAVIQEWHIEEA